MEKRLSYFICFPNSKEVDCDLLFYNGFESMDKIVKEPYKLQNGSCNVNNGISKAS